MRKVESRQQGPPATKVKLDEVLAAHCRADLVTECMKKNTNIMRQGHSQGEARGRAPPPRKN